jgi:O-antigen/teichoic acid export membrane protein
VGETVILGRLIGDRARPVAANVAARFAALISLAVATLVVARLGGPAGVGAYALLRVLPWLAGILLAGGLPGAIPYFLAGPGRSDRRTPLTIIAIALGGGATGGLLWVLGASVLQHAFFRGLPTAEVAWAGLLVLTQLSVVTAKASSQGTDDLAGSNRVFVLEEFLFLPAYLAVLALGATGTSAIIAGLVLADTGTSFLAWRRLVRRGYLRGARRPSLDLGRRVYWFGMRAHFGVVLSLLNLRFDFAILSALAGPATVGVYAIASKYAELLRLFPLALTYVLYPGYAREGPEVAGRKARTLLPRTGLLTAAAAIPLGIGAAVIIPALYGDQFRGAIVPVYILLVGLAGEGIGGVITPFLYGVGRPGLNSAAMASGVAVTVLLDLLLIPRMGVVGAAVASSAAYLTATTVLVGCFWWVRRVPMAKQHAIAGQRSLIPAGEKP